MKVPIRIIDADEGETIAVCKLEEEQIDALYGLFKDMDLTVERFDGDIPEFDKADEVVKWLEKK